MDNGGPKTAVDSRYRMRASHRCPDGMRRGPAVFGYLGEDESAWVPTAEMDRVAAEIGQALADN